MTNPLYKGTGGHNYIEDEDVENTTNRIEDLTTKKALKKQSKAISLLTPPNTTEQCEFCGENITKYQKHIACKAVNFAQKTTEFDTNDIRFPHHQP